MQVVAVALLAALAAAREDWLPPYAAGHGHGPSEAHFAAARARARAREGDQDALFTRAAAASPEPAAPEAAVRHTRIGTDFSITPFQKVHIQGHLFVLDNPVDHFSILEPLGGCAANARATVAETARAHGCVVATNAGFFNTHTDACLGNLVSDGRVVQSPGTRNANFGLTAAGELLVGYLSQGDINGTSGAVGPLDELVAGVVWLVRDGEPYIDASADLEDMTTQETGDSFITVQSARTALGHDAEGRIMLLQIDGQTWSGRGLNLHHMAELLIDLGAQNAINLDGGGSATMFFNGTVVNYPSDTCPEGEPARCDRRVSSITCFHNTAYETACDARVGAAIDEAMQAAQGGKEPEDVDGTEEGPEDHSKGGAPWQTIAIATGAWASIVTVALVVLGVRYHILYRRRPVLAESELEGLMSLSDDEF